MLHMTKAPTLRRIARYGWAAPVSLLGLAAALPAVALGASIQRVDGILEVTGGRLPRWMASLPPACQFGGITLGHVVLCTCPATMAALRSHEQIHVRQHERWGAVFLIAYPASSLWALLCGRNLYRDNWFEQQAYANEAPKTAHHGPTTGGR